MVADQPAGEKLVKIGAKVVRHGRYVIFQIAICSRCRRIVPREFRFCGRSRNHGHSRHQRLREKPDGHVFKGDRWEECVQMPRKMARSDPRPPSGLPVVAAVVRAANPLGKTPDIRKNLR